MLFIRRIAVEYDERNVIGANEGYVKRFVRRQKPGTFMMGGNVLDLVPMHWYDFGGEISHTFNYYFNITFFPWLEVGYTHTLNYAVHGSTYFPPQSWGKYTNQDRSFNARLRLWNRWSSESRG